jgi:hypothetical protein
MLESWERIILAVFSVYRIAHFVILDDGPFDVIFNLRDKLGVYDIEEDGNSKTMTGRFLQCFHCVAKYIAIPIGLLVAFPSTYGDVVLIILGIMGLASVAHLKFKRPH